MVETYYGTKKSCPSGNGRILFINQTWGFEPGEIIKLKIHPLGKPTDVVNTYRKVCALGNNRMGLYLDRAWGFPDDEFLVFALTKVDRSYI